MKSNEILLTNTGGTPSYTKFDKINDKKYCGLPYDIWSYGIILKAILYGYLPFEDENNENDILHD